jgi:hypothetical protein
MFILKGKFVKAEFKTRFKKTGAFALKIYDPV